MTTGNGRVGARRRKLNGEFAGAANSPRKIFPRSRLVLQKSPRYPRRSRKEEKVKPASRKLGRLEPSEAGI